MRILVYGAGVLGSIYAAWLADAGHDLTLLARGQRLAEIRTHGVVLEKIHSGEQTVTRVPAIETLDPMEKYDLVLVVMRRNQAFEVLSTLAANQSSPMVLFLCNNAAGPDAWVDALGRERVLMGFGGVAGVRRGHVICYTSDENDVRGGITIGELDGSLSRRLEEIKAAFGSARVPVEFSPNIDAWLKSHVALVNPIALAVYLAAGDNYRLARTRDGVLLMVRAIGEGFKVLQRLEIPILPSKFKLMLRIPEPILVPWLQRLMASEFAEIGMAGHANAARDEFRQLGNEFARLTAASGVATPNLDQLGRYLDPAVPPMPDGSRSMPLNWRPVWLGLGAVATVLALLFAFWRKRP